MTSQEVLIAAHVRPPKIRLGFPIRLALDSSTPMAKPPVSLRWQVSDPCFRPKAIPEKVTSKRVSGSQRRTVTTRCTVKTYVLSER